MGGLKRQNLVQTVELVSGESRKCESKGERQMREQEVTRVSREVLPVPLGPTRRKDGRAVEDADL